MTKYYRIYLPYFLVYLCSSIFLMDSLPHAEENKSQISHQEVVQSIKDQINAWQKNPTATPSNEESKAESTSSPKEESSSSEADTTPTQKAIHTKLSVEGTPEHNLKIDLYFKLGTPFFSVFSQDTTWYIVLSHPSEIDITPYDENIFTDLKKITHFPIDGGVVIKFNLAKHLYPKITYNEDSDIISLIFVDKIDVEERTEDIHLPTKTNSHFRIQQDNGRVDLDFIDEDGTFIWAICASGDNRPIHFHTYPEFTILDSYQGVAFRIKKDDLDLDFNGRKVIISSPNGLAVSLEDKTERPPQSIPSLFENFDLETAKKNNVDLIQSIIQNPEDLKKTIEAIINYTGLQLIPEALSFTHRLTEHCPDILLMPAFRATEGLCQLLMDRFEKANECLSSLSYDLEPKFWLTLAEASKNLFALSPESQKLPKYKNALKKMPQTLRDALLIKILLSGIHQKNEAILKTFTSKDMKPKSYSANGYFKLATAIYIIAQGDKSNTKLLKDLLSFTEDPQIPVIAKFELLKLEPKDEKNIPEELKQLDALCYQWRGDLLEYKINTYLANRYIDCHKHQSALPIYRRMIKYFKDYSYQEELPKKMRNTLITYFKQDPFPPVLEALSVLQEYGDIAPNTEEGDDLIIRATKPLVNLELYDEAINIISNYIDTKCVQEENQDDSELQKRKNKLYYRLAVIQFLHAQPNKTLDAIKHIENPSDDMSQNIHLLKAECFNDLNQFDEAIAILGDTSEEIMKKGALYLTKTRWSDASEQYAKILSKYDDDQKSIPEEILLTALLDTAVCYAALKQEDEIKNIKEKYNNVIKDSKIQPAMDFLTSDLSFNDLPQLTEDKLSNVIQLEKYSKTLKKLFS